MGKYYSRFLSGGDGLNARSLVKSPRAKHRLGSDASRGIAITFSMGSDDNAYGIPPVSGPLGYTHPVQCPWCSQRHRSNEEALLFGCLGNCSLAPGGLGRQIMEVLHHANA